MPRALADLLSNTPLSPGKVDFAWRVTVGPAMSRGTAVRLEGTVLLVDAQSPQWSREVARSSPIILRRLQSLLGDGAVKEITVRA